MPQLDARAPMPPAIAISSNALPSSSTAMYRPFSVSPRWCAVSRGCRLEQSRTRHRVDLAPSIESRALGGKTEAHLQVDRSWSVRDRALQGLGSAPSRLNEPAFNCEARVELELSRPRARNFAAVITASRPAYADLPEHRWRASSVATPSWAALG